MSFHFSVQPHKKYDSLYVEKRKLKYKLVRLLQAFKNCMLTRVKDLKVTKCLSAP